MANISQAASPPPKLVPRPAPTHEELRRQLALIEDRPEETLTWADAIAFVRSAARSVESASRRLRR